MTESDLNIALSLCKVCPVSSIDEVARMLLAVFDSRNKTMPLLKAIIEKEVESTGTLSRYLSYLYLLIVTIDRDD